jgi:DNA processing protein
MNTIYWLALTYTHGIGSVTIRNLLNRFGDIESIFDASPEEIARIPRISLSTAQSLLSIPFEQLEAELLSLNDEGIDVVTWDDDLYPTNLIAINDAPGVLFVRGSILPADDRAVGIVGTREPTEQAVDFAQTLSRELAARGLTVVSGLAAGVDTAAHQGALTSQKGRTFAVLGSGIRVIHPKSNTQLAEQIVNHGALLSELHPNAPPRGPQLMARDRIISGLSRVVIVVEAGVNSGSMDTASRAKKQKRPDYAVPGSSGTDALLNEGARPIFPDMVNFGKLAEDILNNPVGTINSSPKQARLF